jgi:uncharacterized protein DUF4166
VTLPFQAALGAAIEAVAPGVKAHFLQQPGTCRYRGTMRRVWRRSGWRGWLAGPVLRIGSWTDTLFANTGTDVPFELENIVTARPDGRTTMGWTRTFHFREGTRRFHGLMLFSTERGSIVDWLGKTHHLEVELHPRIEEGAIFIDSGRQWLKVGPVRVPVPRWLAGRARIHEWDLPDGSLGIRVTIDNPLLGEFFGYEGSFARVEDPVAE